MLLYQEIRQYLFVLIAEHPELKKLPSERELLEKFNSTRITVREALTRLEAEGIIYRQNRKGWFICPPRLKWDPVKKVNFYQLAQEQHFTPLTQLVSFETTAASEVVNDAFELGSPGEFHRISRVRSLDERPVMVEEIYCLASQFGDLQHKPLEGSITTIFEQDYGVNVTHERSSLIVTAIPDDKAELLNVNKGALCLKIIRQRFNQLDKLIDYNLEYWVHSTIEIEVDSK
ncbi:UTRA domain-containing protein [Pseudoalteromonas luteoviolacea]|uniref:UTRA domain-containing protein n=1 Tax=Pseudoalteromonas luteoviolacea TaxID=43657 RepID=UPI001B399934|nr:UTRA domain-containing protein [Pseudoalteromonas luteoviolacea]MBQ4837475.1 UTRA domain-containing protein [Pseudoalteromonas luteoviolacea]